MTWALRRSIKMGPLRLNVSVEGLGISTGVRGARVSVGPRGTYVTLGRGGFQYRKKIAIRHVANERPRVVPPAPETGPSRTAHAEVGYITSATASELAVLSPDAMLHDTQSYLNRTNVFRLYMVAAVLAIIWAFSALIPVAAVALLVVLVSVGIPIRTWDLERRTARIFYDVDDQEVVDRIAIANSVGQSLSTSACLWHIFYSANTDDWKKNAGAGALIRRTSIRASVGTLPQIELNIEPWCIPFGPQRLLFLPDRLMVWDGKKLAGVPYENLEVNPDKSRFIEEGSVPRDSRRVGTTWRFVRRDGGPDLRFKNNAQLPILEYGRLEIVSQSGLRIVLQTSTPAPVVAAAKMLAELSRRATQHFEEMLSGAADAERREVSDDAAQLPGVAVNPPTDPALKLAGSVSTLLKYIASADRRLATEELRFAESVIRTTLPPGHAHADELVEAFRNLPTDAESISSAIAVLRSTSPQYRVWTMDVLRKLSLADGKTTPKETERLDELDRALGA